MIAVEIDKNLIPILEDTLSGYDNVRVINEDVLKLDLKKLCRRREQRKAGQSGGEPAILYYDADHHGTF